MDKVKVYLDDVRTPITSDRAWIVVRNYDEFVDKINEIDRSKSYHKLSPSGEYILRKISERNYQLEHLGQNSSYNESLKYSGTVKSVRFSLKSDFIIGTFRTRRSLDMVTLFDIVKKGVDLIHAQEQNPIIELFEIKMILDKEGLAQINQL